MSSPTLVTVILNWNNAGLAIACAESVLQAYDNTHTGAAHLELVLVDNASDPDDFQLLQNWSFQAHRYRVSLIRNTANLGYAGGMNTGIKDALRQSPTYLWLLNNDTEVAVDSVSQLFEFAAKNSRASVIGATMLDAVTFRVLTAGGYRYFPWLGYSRPIGAGLSAKECLGTTPVSPDYIDGAAMWLRSDVLRRCKGLPERNFLYFEELELNEMLLPDEGIAWCPAARVTHRGGASSETTAPSRASYYAALSAFRYTARVYPRYLPTVIAARVLGVSLLAARRLRPAMLGGVLRALWTFVRRRRG